MPLNKKKPFKQEKPFPRKCFECGQNEVDVVEIDFDADVRHDGKKYSFVVPSLNIQQCASCGAKVFTEDVDDQINAQLRLHIGLMSPEDIRDGIRGVGRTQKQVGEALGISPSTISRWIASEQIQSRSLDKLLRIYFRFDEVRNALDSGEVTETVSRTASSGNSPVLRIFNPERPQGAPGFGPTGFEATG
ncbi:helix-turn-helix domain-containing protein [Planctomycetota bacterium]